VNDISTRYGRVYEGEARYVQQQITKVYRVDCSTMPYVNGAGQSPEDFFFVVLKHISLKRNATQTSQLNLLLYPNETSYYNNSRSLDDYLI